MRSSRHNHHGFSLVELSIVLVILGLLTGGILAGQSLIHASELRAVTTEYNKYVAATQAFRDKYFALPGDMSNATKFWDVLAVPAGTCNTTLATDAKTCDGDGNGIIGVADGLGYEPYRFWQHLANAGLIEGTYPGFSAAGYANVIFGESNPKSRFGQAGWCVRYHNDAVGGARFYADPNPAHFLTIGATDPSDPCEGGAMVAEDVWNLDTKLDDGMPATGSVHVGNRTTCSISAAPTDMAGTYDLADRAIGCFAIVRWGT